jgi:hypothetical protein
MIVLSASGAHITENPGWGKLAFLMGAALLFWLGKSTFERWVGLKKDGPSPAPRKTPASGVKPQVSDTADTVLTPRGTASGGADKDLDVFVEKHAERLPTNDLVRLATAQFRASRSTILRRLREAKRRKEYGEEHGS